MNIKERIHIQISPLQNFYNLSSDNHNSKYSFDWNKFEKQNKQKTKQQMLLSVFCFFYNVYWKVWENLRNLYGSDIILIYVDKGLLNCFYFKCLKIYLMKSKHFIFLQ